MASATAAASGGVGSSTPLFAPPVPSAALAPSVAQRPMSSSAPVQEAAMSAHGATKRRHSSHGTSGDEEDEDRSTVEDAVDNKRRRLSTGSSEGAGADVGSGNGSGSASNGNVGGPMAPAAPAPASSTSSADGVESSVRKVTPVASWHKYRYGAGAESEGRSGIPPLTSTGRPGEVSGGALQPASTAAAPDGAVPANGPVVMHASAAEVLQTVSQSHAPVATGTHVPNADMPAAAAGPSKQTAALLELLPVSSQSWLRPLVRAWLTIREKYELLRAELAALGTLPGLVLDAAAPPVVNM